MKTVEELLKPRWKVIADYPGALHNIGDVISAYENGEAYLVEGDSYSMVDYPALFKRLEWWEDRAVEDMPEYVKYNPPIVPYPSFKQGEIINVLYWLGDATKKNNLYFVILDLDEIGYNPNHFVPATEEEYLSFINSQKK